MFSVFLTLARYHIPTMKLSSQTFLNLVLPEVVLACIFVIVVHCIWLRKCNKPFTCWPVVGMLPSYLLAIKTGFHEVAADILHDHSGTFTIKGPWFTNFDQVVTSDPCNLEYILKTNFSNFVKGETTHAVTEDLIGDGLYSADDEKWNWLRKLTSAKLHLAGFNKMAMESWFVLIQSRLLPISENFIKHNATFDLQDVLSRLAFDQSCIIAFGVDPGYLGDDFPMVKFARAFKKAEELIALRFYFPMFFWKLMNYFDLGWEREMKIAINNVNEFAHKVITSRRTELSKNVRDKKSRSDFLSLLMESRDENGNCYSDKFFRDNCLNLMLAGSDTIAVSLAWFFWLLHQNPIVEELIYAEVCGILMKAENYAGRGEQDIGATFGPEEAKKMCYLHAALTETMRLYPPVPLNQVRVHRDDQFPSGAKLKRGTRVLYSAYAMGRMKGIWGTDCREFKPERWLKDGALISESSYKLPAFNAGLRTCLGKDLAYHQMKVIAASIIYHYRVIVADYHPVPPKLSLLLHMRYGLKVTLERRHASLP